MSSELRLGLAGARFGEKHAAAFCQVDGVILAAISDPDESRRQALVDEYEIKRAFDTYDEMLEAGELDAVVICLPTALHERSVSAAFDAGLHVLCEKPPAVSESEMSKIVSSAGFCGKTYMWARQHRFSPAIAMAREIIERGEIGEAYRGESSWQWAWWPFENDNWRGNRENGGGVLLDIGIHMIDSVWYPMGCPDPVEAMASRHSLFLDRRVPDRDEVAEDSVYGMLRFKNGSSMSFSTAFFGHFEGEKEPWGSPNNFGIQIFGTSGSLDLAKGHRVVAQQPEIVSTSYVDGPIDESDWFLAQAQEFVDAIREEREPLNDGKQGLTLMRMLDALALSAKEKRAIPIKATRSLDDLFGGL